MCNDSYSMRSTLVKGFPLDFFVAMIKPQDYEIKKLSINKLYVRERDKSHNVMHIVIRKKKIENFINA